MSLPAQPESVWHVGYAWTLEELSGEQISIDGFLRELGKLCRADVLEWAGALLQIVSSYGGQGKSIQIELIDLCLEGNLQTAALKALASEGRNVVFHRRALWLMLQCASLVCSQDGTPIYAPNGQFGRLALAASDCIRLIQLAQVSTAEADKSDLAWQSALLTSVAEVMPGANGLARANAFWFDSVADAAVRTELARCGLTDLDQAFVPIYGASLSDTLFAHTTLYNFVAARVKKRPIEPTVLSADDSWWGAVPTEVRANLLEKLSIPETKLPAHLLGTPRQSWATDLSLLMNHPLVESFPGRFVCPDIGYLANYLADKVFWLFKEALRDKEWSNVFGAIYEWYVRELLGAAARRSAAPGVFYRSVKFERDSNKQVCDALMLTSDMAALFESKGTRLTTRQKSGVSVEETADAIRRSVGSEISGVGQLAKNIGKVLRGDKVSADGKLVDVAAKQKIVPILVWYEASACHGATRQMLNSVLLDTLKEKSIDQSRVGPLILMSLDDLEIFEQCSALMPADDLLQQFVTFVDEYPDDARAMFLRYAFWAFEGQRPPLGYVGEKVNQLADRMRARHARRSGVGGKLN